MRHVLHTTLIGVLAVLVQTAGSEAAGTCFADWSEAAPVVKEQGLMPVEQLMAPARQKLNGDIVKTTLCHENGTYVYKLVIKGANGQTRSVTLDARDPFPN